MKLLDVIIPTYNNPEQLLNCVDSLARTCGDDALNLLNIIIVNNGQKGIEKHFICENDNPRVLSPGENIGWEGGLKEGLKYTETDFVMFLNDDTFFPDSSRLWLQKMLSLFSDSSVAAVGPITNVVMGLQNMLGSPRATWHEVSYLVGFAMIVRRKYLEEVGGVDDSLPGGDDIDLSIRFRKKGYKLLVNRDVFIYHYGFQTGKRVYGDYWNSQDMQDRTNICLIKKHGMKEWWKSISGYRDINPYGYPVANKTDIEGDICRSFAGDAKQVLDLGCGGRKTLPHAVGVDIVPEGSVPPFMDATISVSDVVADVSNSLPFAEKSQDVIIARHILEHCIDTIKTLKEWIRVLKPGGKLIVAVPEEGIMKSIPMNPEHVHAFTQSSLVNIMEMLGLKTLACASSGNGVSFVGCFEKAVE